MQFEKKWHVDPLKENKPTLSNNKVTFSSSGHSQSRKQVNSARWKISYRCLDVDTLYVLSVMMQVLFNF